MKIRLGEAIPVQPDKRLHDHVMDSAMGDVIDALVELITNADDSYGRLYRARRRPTNRGSILIERCEQRKEQESFLVVRDRAEGMTLERMIEVLRSPGALTSSSGDRGYMGRGAKDCARFGSLTVESVKDARYYACILTKRAKDVIPHADSKADEATRTRIGVPHGNGTQVRLEVGEEHKVPQIKTLCEELSCHYALQDILDEERGGEVLLRNGLRQDEKPERLIARRPVCETVCEAERYSVPGYDGAFATLSIYRVEEPFEEKPPRTRRYGFLIAGERAIHERSLLDNLIERDPNSHRYFGRIECHYIDRLMDESEARRRTGQPHPESNPRLLVDPGRRHGLEKDHPFTKALLELPISRMRELLDDERKKAQAKRKQIGNEETRNRLDRLARAASRFLQQQINDLEVLGTDQDVDDDSFVRTGMLIYPTYLNVEVGRERELTVYVNKALVQSADENVFVSVDGPGLDILDSVFKLRPHRDRDDRWVGTFRVRGRAVASDVCISAKCNGLPPAKAIAQVIESKPVDRNFGEPFEFEHD